MDSTFQTPLESFKDRKGGLIGFGLMTVLLGGTCALLIPLMFFSLSMAAKGGIPQPTSAIVPAIGIYGIMAVVLISLGIGSMMARRWARALLLILGWSWLVTGVIAMGTTLWMMPQTLDAAMSMDAPGQPAAPAGTKSMMTAVMVFTTFFMGVICILIPGTLVLFYRSPHVKATCEAADPVERWTDRCPLPVVGVSLWVGFMALMLLVSAVATKGMLPFFGTLVTGVAGTAGTALVSAILGYAAWALYRLKSLGWWLTTVTIVAFAISGFTTFWRHDMMDIYAHLGYSAEQLALLQKFNVWSGHRMAWFCVAYLLPTLSYLLYVRRFFPFGTKAGSPASA